MNEVPQDLTALEYARHLLENTLGWPCKGNLEMIADCITSLSKAKKITLPKSLAYLERAVKLAREQSIEVNRFFFQEGTYTNIRPSRSMPVYEPIDRKKTEQEQSTPEWQAASEKARQLWRQIAGMSQKAPYKRQNAPGTKIPTSRPSGSNYTANSGQKPTEAVPSDSGATRETRSQS